MDSDERRKLAALLNYWVKHNVEHGEEFREWADKAGKMGEAVVQNSLHEAADLMFKANESLEGARQKLG